MKYSKHVVFLIDIGLPSLPSTNLSTIGPPSRHSISMLRSGLFQLLVRPLDMVFPRLTIGLGEISKLFGAQNLVIAIETIFGGGL